jgi:hypothetical protein
MSCGFSLYYTGHGLYQLTDDILFLIKPNKETRQMITLLVYKLDRFFVAFEAKAAKKQGDIF